MPVPVTSRFFLSLWQKSSSRSAGGGEGAPGGEKERSSILHGGQQQEQRPLPAHQLLPRIQLIFPDAYEEHKLTLTHAQKKKQTTHTHTHTAGLICALFATSLIHSLGPQYKAGERGDAVVSFSPYILYSGFIASDDSSNTSERERRERAHIKGGGGVLYLFIIFHFIQSVFLHVAVKSRN